MPTVNIEILITIAVVCIQLIFYFSTFRKIRELKNLFPDKDLDEKDVDQKEIENGKIEQIKIDSNSLSQDFENIIDSINKYLIKNRGVTDFAIIKSIVERKLESKENHVSSNLSLPLYIGLMGTFIGIIFGLFFISFSPPSTYLMKSSDSKESVSKMFNISSEDLDKLNSLKRIEPGQNIVIEEGGISSKKNIESFIGGVVIAMIASFFGLLLTVINNSFNFKNAKTICDEKKNSFFNFLQIELLPFLENSLYDALDRLKLNINDFNKKFETNIQLFDSKFSVNILSLKDSVQLLAGNMSTIVENTKSQKEFLIRLDQIGYEKMANANAKVFKLIDKVSPTMLLFIDKQSELTQSVENATQFVSVIENILNRIKTFEQSINNLGENINSKEYLGNEVLKRIDGNLRYLDKQFELLKRHELTSSQEINDFFSTQYDKIKGLTENIKREVERALDLNIDNNPFQKLKLLDGMHNHLNTINEKLDFKEDFKKLSKDLNTSKDDIQEIKQNLVIAIKENRERNMHEPSIVSKGKENGKLKNDIPKERKTFIKRFVNFVKLGRGRKT